MSTKKCRICGIEKDLETGFTKDRRQKDGYNTMCKECKRKKDRERYERIKNDPEFHAKKLEHSKKYREKHKDKILEYSLEYNNRPEVIERKSIWYQNKQNNKTIQDRIHDMFIRAKNRAIEKSLPFDIEESDLIPVECCPLLEIPLNWGACVSQYGRDDNTPSLDKIIPSKGYIKGNVRIISNLANMMKSSATKEQLITFSRNIIKYMENEDIVQTIENKNL